MCRGVRWRRWVTAFTSPRRLGLHQRRDLYEAGTGCQARRGAVERVNQRRQAKLNGNSLLSWASSTHATYGPTPPTRLRPPPTTPSSSARSLPARVVRLSGTRCRSRSRGRCDRSCAATHVTRSPQSDRL